MKKVVHSGLKHIALDLLIMLCFARPALAQDTTGVLRITNGIPAGMKRIPPIQMDRALQKAALKKADRYGYKFNKEWEDTVKYWTDEKNIRAVSFINSAYEYTTVIFDQHGKWLQTTNYLNPELSETSKITTAVDEREYSVQSYSSPIGSIIKYRTTHDTWYEAEVYEVKDPLTTLWAVLDKQFHIISVKK